MAPSAPGPRKRRRRPAADQSPPSQFPDRLSYLSDDLLRDILLRLPTRLAVSFSILSRRFHHLPSLLPRLDSLSPTTPALPLPTASPLLLRRLSLVPDAALPASSFRSVLHSASLHGVSELSIRLSHRACVPLKTFTIKSLVVLSLSNCNVLRLAVVACPLLRTLKLERVAVRQDALAGVLKSATTLETLNLVYCTWLGTGTCTVEAGALRNFVLRPPLELVGAVVRAERMRVVTLYTRPKMTRLELAPAPEVRKAYLHVAHPQGVMECRLRPFLDASVGLTCLTLRGAAMKFLSSEYGAIQKLAVSFQDLRVLSVSLDFSSESELVFLLKLLESCPSVQELNLSAAEAHKENASPIFTEHKKRLEMTPCLTKNLTKLKFLGFKPEQYEKEFVRFLLTKVKKLKSMMLEFNRTHMDAVKEIFSARKAPIERTSTHKNNSRIQLEFS